MRAVATSRRKTWYATPSPQCLSNPLQAMKCTKPRESWSQSATKPRFFPQSSNSSMPSVE